PVHTIGEIMAHQIEAFADGTAAFVTARQDAWHRLGTVTAECLSAAEVLQIASLGGWNVRKERLQAAQSGALVPERYAITRVHPKTGQREGLATAGRAYQP